MRHRRSLAGASWPLRQSDLPPWSGPFGPMPDTVDSPESFSLIVIVNRHPVAEDCAQSRPREVVPDRKSQPRLTDRYNQFARSVRQAKTANERASHFDSTMADSRSKRPSSTSGRSSITSKPRCFGLMKPSCTA